MYLLINTIRNSSLLALFDKTKEIDFFQWDSQNKQSEELLTFINELLKKNGCALKKLKGVGVINGPGSYTGIRVGVTMANSLAYARNINIVGINILEIMSAYYFNAFGSQKVTAVMHAIYDKYYYARYSKTSSKLFLQELGNKTLPDIFGDGEDQYIFLNEKSVSKIEIKNSKLFNLEQRIFIEKYFLDKILIGRNFNQIAQPFYINQPNIVQKNSR